MLEHKFILVSQIPGHELYSRFFPKEDLIIISDSFILEHHVPLMAVEMYSNDLGNKKKGLSYYSVSILDPQMAANLKEEMLKYPSECEDYKKLMSILDEAIGTKQYIIHFGI